MRSLVVFLLLLGASPVLAQAPAAPPEPPPRLEASAQFAFLDTSGNSSSQSLGAAYRLEISPTSEFTYEPRDLLPFAETGDWKFDQDVALKVGLNSLLSLKVSHTLR